MSSERSNSAGPGTWASRARVRHRLNLLLAALAIVTASVARVHALDLSADYTGGGGFVLKRFKAPVKNKCAPLQAFENVKSGAGISATACTASTGRWMILHYTSHSWGGQTEYSETATCRVLLPIPADSGNLGRCDGSFVSSPGGAGGFAQSALFHFCSADIPE